MLAAPGAVDALLADAVARRVTPGVVVEAGSSRGVVWQGAAGRHTYADDAAAVRVDTIYDLASLTKVLATTTLAMRAHVAYVLRDNGMGRKLRLAENALEAPIAALEAIPVGTDTIALGRSYVIELLGRLERLRGPDGRGLTPEQRALPRRLATLHGEGSTDPVAFRALRRTATATTDAASVEIEAAIMAFVESLAWPLAGLTAELPDILQRGHQGLRAALAPERPTPVETTQLKAVDAMFDALDERRRAEPSLDTEAEVARIEATPEFAAVVDLAFQVRLEHYDALAAEAYAPFAVDLLLTAFRKA